MFVGQEDLLFSNPQGIAEIFKIHGSLKKPESLVLTSKDYEEFSQKRAYLAAKLLTIFLEYPVIFIGYSINDRNVQEILSAIIGCLSEPKLEKLSKSLIFVERDRSLDSDIELETHSKEVNGKNLLMTNVRTNNFQLLFEGLKVKDRGVPIKLLRMFKEQIYYFCLTSKPTKHLLVDVGDPRISEDKLVFSIGIERKPSEKGLIGITLKDWYKEVVVGGTISYSAEQLLELGYQQVKKHSGGHTPLPVFKFLSESGKTFSNIDEVSQIKSLDDLLSDTIRKNKKSSTAPRTIDELFISERFANERIYEGWAYLPENAIDIQKLESFLQKKFEENPSLLSSVSAATRTSINRLIRIYDWLKFGKKNPAQTS